MRATNSAATMMAAIAARAKREKERIVFILLDSVRPWASRGRTGDRAS